MSSGISQEIINRVEAKVLECIAIAENHFLRPFGFPTIEYDLKGRTAGKAYLRRGLIKLNRVLLIENVDDFINNTVPHEVAHLIDHAVNNTSNSLVSAQMAALLEKHNYSYPTRRDRAHGPTWKAIMKLFGCEPTRCHDYDTTNSEIRRGQKYEYMCSCCDRRVTLGKTRHERERNRPGTYRLTGHRGKLVFIGGPTRPTKVATLPKAGTKLAVAFNTYESLSYLSRETIINTIADTLNVKHATAQQYYYKAKKYFDENTL